jgi:hypothetical protein
MSLNSTLRIKTMTSWQISNGVQYEDVFLKEVIFYILISNA